MKKIQLTAVLLLMAAIASAQNNCLYFDGINDYVQAPNSATLNFAGSYTVECWIKADVAGLSPLAGLVSKNNAAGSNGFTLRLSGSAPYTGLNFDGLETASGVIAGGKWHFITAVNNAGARTLYVDGIAQPLTGTSYTATGNSDPLTIGADYLPSPRYFNGIIDEVRLYSIAKTQAAVRADMLGGATATGLAANYTFNTASAGNNNAGFTNLQDFSGNGNNGTLHNFTLNGSTSNWVGSYAQVVPVSTGATHITGTGFTANWTTPVSGSADSYVLDVATDASFTAYVSGYAGHTVGNATSFTVAGLMPSTTYYYRVHAVNNILGQGPGSVADSMMTRCYATNKLYVNNAVAVSGDGTTWATAIKELRDAMPVANSCTYIDSILVAAGTYYTPNTMANMSFSIGRGNLKLYGGYEATGSGIRNIAANPTYLDGNVGDTASELDNSDVIFSVINLPVGADSVVLDGFTLRNGVNGASASGAAFRNNGNGAKNVIRNCTFTGNIAAGGAIGMFSTSCTISNCILNDNYLFDGGAIFGTSTNGSKMIVTGCRVYNNTAAYGGGVRMEGDMNFKGVGNIFNNNEARSGGGGVVSFDATGTDTLVNNLFIYNKEAGSSIGGALALTQGSHYLANNTIYKDSASDGGAIGIFSPAVVSAYNNIFYKNYSRNGLASSNDISGTYTGSNNSFSTTNPSFINENDPDGADNIYGTGDDGLMLNAFSPAFNTGSNSSVPADITTDIANATRIQNGTVDMGAYEGTRFNGNKIYVNQAAGGDGSSWITAVKEVRDALTIVNTVGGIDTIWVAAGTYKPTSGTDRSAAFAMKNNLAILGGFAGSETLLSQRNSWAHVSILSGDIGTTGSNSDNCFHVIYNYISGLNNTAVLDGFTISGGNANSTTPFDFNGGGIVNYNSSPTISNCIIRDNAAKIAGGGCNNTNSSSVIKNCIFLSNTSINIGAGLSLAGDASQVTNCVFINNSGVIGGGIRIEGSSNSAITNCTFTGNNATSGGAMEVASGSNPLIKNCIVWGNLGTNPGILNNVISPGNPTVANCIIQGGYTGNSSSDPLFVNAADPDGADNIWGTNDEGLKLKVLSPAANTGDNSSIAGITRDITGSARIQNTVVDMGAYEGSTFSGHKMYVNQAVATGGDGTSWATAAKELSDAIAAARNYSSIDTIWVAAGAYKPTTGTDRNLSFFMRNNLAILGGFAGMEASFSQRNFKTNVTILSGDIGTANDNSDNSYHVVSNNNNALNNTALLDGFTITKGNANGGIAFGGGIYNYNNTSPVISNCIIRDNNASTAGGGCINDNSNAKITNCFFVSNTSSVSFGGGLYLNASASQVTNCVFINNTANTMGGAIRIAASSTAAITNCTFTGNNAPTGSAIEVSSSSTPVIKNCIFWGNLGASAPLVNSVPTPGNPTVANCIVQGGYTGAGNSSGDPLFANPSDPDGADNIFGTSDDGLTLTGSSPALNAGDNNGVPAGITTDIAGAERIQSGTVDMGAYEGAFVFPNKLCVNQSVPVSGDGGSWATAFKELRDALTVTTSNNHIDSVLVAAGTYLPTTTTDTTISFTITRGGLKLVGGYATDGSGNRNIAGNATYLDGNIGATGTAADNSVHVVNIVNIAATQDSIILDGFTIRNGYNTLTTGGGIRMVQAHNANMIRNCSFSKCHSLNGGGIYADSSSLTLLACNFNNDTATNGGAAQLTNSASYLISNCSFTGNSASNNGGCVYANSSSLSVLGSSFTGNTASVGGGLVGNAGITQLTQCIFTGNKATNNGGAVTVGGPSAGITGCIFNGNSTSGSGVGGAVQVTALSFKATNNIFKGNTTNNTGGGISLFLTNTDTLANNLFIANKANNSGGAVYAVNGAHYIVNNTFYADTATGNAGGVILGGSGISYAFNNIFYKCKAGANQDLFGTGITLVAANNSLNASNPMFVNEGDAAGADNTWGTADDGLQLMSCSPAINSGANASVPSSVTTDIAGAARIQGNIADAGAYENTGFILDSTPNSSFTTTNACTNTDGWQHFYDAATGKLVLSINTNSQNLGTITADSKLSGQYGSNTNTSLNNPFGLSNTFYPFNRSWHVSTATAPTSPVTVRFYFNAQDSMDISATHAFSSLQQLVLYKVSGTDAYNASASGYKQYAYAAAADTSHYSFGTYQGIRYAEFQANNFSAGSMALLGGSPLPLKLVSFSGTKHGNDNLLAWKMENEDDVDEYIIERSMDAASFISIGAIKNSRSGQYSFTDKAPLNGDHYYRLRMVDNNGHYTYSNTVRLSNDATSKVTASVYPNPATDKVRIVINGTDLTEIELQYSDMMGKTVRTITYPFYPGRIIEDDISGLASGNYILTIPGANAEPVKIEVLQ